MDTLEHVVEPIQRNYAEEADDIVAGTTELLAEPLHLQALKLRHEAQIKGVSNQYESKIKELESKITELRGMLNDSYGRAV